MKAVKAVELGKIEVVDVKEPEFNSDSILVRPLYAGLNPCDVRKDISPRQLVA
jgi:NADPH:quinone reductase-like Zn-dependent oxidoreductase